MTRIGRAARTTALGIASLLVGCLLQAGQASAASVQTTAPGVPTCALRNLSVTAVKGSAVSNQEAILIRFRDTSRTSCALSGYPKAVALRPGTSSVALDRLSIYNGGWTSGLPPLVVLRHGQSASALVGGTSTTREGQSTACDTQTYKTVRISLGGGKGSVLLSAHIPGDGPLYLPSCAGVSVTPFAPGVGWFLPAPVSR
ncbi:MAG TPA: DUF4232 domain-containing protein [Acidimicrobiales bacterium]|jgi:hypothetical protein|nr:DUF4232 domain-containing protein [Acidimicrobiales bacterium]